MFWKIAAVVVALIGIGAILYGAALSNPINHDAIAVVCPNDTKICSDGAIVGRAGANCLFSDCPILVGSSTQDGTQEFPTTSEGDVRIHVGEKASYNSVTITPLAIISDSRCPSDPKVQCIWAGTVQIKALIESDVESAVKEIELNKPVTTFADVVTLTAVTPEKSLDAEIATSSYEFTFRVARRVPGR